MKRLLISLLVGLLALLPMPVRAGSAESNTSTTAYSIAPGYVAVVEKRTTDGRSFLKQWNNGSWTGWSLINPNTPQINFGNLTGIRTDGHIAFWGQLSNGSLHCSIDGGAWHEMASGFDWFGNRATPAVFNEAGFGSFGPAMRVMAVDPIKHVRSATWASDLGCDPLALRPFSDTGGATPWSPGAAGTSDSDYLISVVGDGPTDAQPVWWSDTNGPWHETSGRCKSGVAVTTWGGRRYDIFCRGQLGYGDAMWHLADPIFGGTWENLEGQFQGGPGCAAWDVYRIDCFAVGLNSNIYHAAWNGPPLTGSWQIYANGTKWEDIGSA